MCKVGGPRCAGSNHKSPEQKARAKAAVHFRNQAASQMAVSLSLHGADPELAQKISNAPVTDVYDALRIAGMDPAAVAARTHGVDYKDDKGNPHTFILDEPAGAVRRSPVTEDTLKLLQEVDAVYNTGDNPGLKKGPLRDALLVGDRDTADELRAKAAEEVDALEESLGGSMENMSDKELSKLEKDLHRKYNQIGTQTDDSEVVDDLHLMLADAKYHNAARMGMSYENTHNDANNYQYGEVNSEDDAQRVVELAESRWGDNAAELETYATPHLEHAMRELSSLHDQVEPLSDEKAEELSFIKAGVQNEIERREERKGDKAAAKARAAKEKADAEAARKPRGLSPKLDQWKIAGKVKDSRSAKKALDVSAAKWEGVDFNTMDGSDLVRARNGMGVTLTETALHGASNFDDVAKIVDEMDKAIAERGLDKTFKDEDVAVDPSQYLGADYYDSVRELVDTSTANGFSDMTDDQLDIYIDSLENLKYELENMADSEDNEDDEYSSSFNESDVQDAQYQIEGLISRVEDERVRRLTSFDELFDNAYAPEEKSEVVREWSFAAATGGSGYTAAERASGAYIESMLDRPGVAPRRAPRNAVKWAKEVTEGEFDADNESMENIVGMNILANDAVAKWSGDKLPSSKPTKAEMEILRKSAELVKSDSVVGFTRQDTVALNIDKALAAAENAAAAAAASKTKPKAKAKDKDKPKAKYAEKKSHSALAKEYSEGKPLYGPDGDMQAMTYFEEGAMATAYTEGHVEQKPNDRPLLRADLNRLRNTVLGQVKNQLADNMGDTFPHDRVNLEVTLDGEGFVGYNVEVPAVSSSADISAEQYYDIVASTTRNVLKEVLASNEPLD